MDKLIVKNFGPIRDISIDVNDINIFIGPTSSGKSTVAKLIAILVNANQESGFIMSDDRANDFAKFKKCLKDYNIDFEIRQDTEITFIDGTLTMQVKNNQFTYDNKPDEENRQVYDSYWPVYIPAERMLLPNVGESLFGLMKNNVSISESLKEFGSIFELSRKDLKAYHIPFLEVKYEYSDGNYLTLADGIKIKLEQASSGMQSSVPLVLVIGFHADNYRENFYIVEEPELNLYPTMQKALIEFIVSKASQNKSKLIITTHSPYTLTAIDNLIQAKNAFEQHPELKEEINKVVPENLWVDFNKVSCYYFEDGRCRSTLDMESRSIGSSNIDDVSESLGATFDQLLALKYHD
jgi:predicted ATPase